MILTGQVWKEGHWWMIECPALDAMTQGKTKADALRMMGAWVRDALDQQDYVVEIEAAGANGFEMAVADPAPILGLLLDRQRQRARLTYRELAAAAGQKSTGAVTGYLRGKHAPSLEKLGSLLAAMGVGLRIDVTPVASSQKRRAKKPAA